MKIQLRPLSFPIALLILGSLAASLTAGTICPAVGIATPGTGANAGTGCFVLFTYSNNAAGHRELRESVFQRRRHRPGLVLLGVLRRRYVL